MDPVVMIAFEVGPKKERLLGKYAGGNLSVELEKPVQFGTLSELLKQYDVPVDTWPSFLQKVMELQAWLWALDYRAVKVGKTSSTTLSSGNVTTDSGQTFPSELDGAVIEADSTDASKYTVKKNGKTLQYSVTKAGDQYSIEANVYKFLIQGAYENALPIVDGLLALKSLAFGITNDPTIDTTDFEKACRKVLDSAQSAAALPG